MGATCLKSKVCSCGTKFGNLSQEIKMDVHFCIVHFCTQSSYKKKPHKHTDFIRFFLHVTDLMSVLLSFFYIQGHFICLTVTPSNYMSY